METELERLTSELTKATIENKQNVKEIEKIKEENGKLESELVILRKDCSEMVGKIQEEESRKRNEQKNKGIKRHKDKTNESILLAKYKKKVTKLSKELHVTRMKLAAENQDTEEKQRQSRIRKKFGEMRVMCLDLQKRLKQ